MRAAVDLIIDPFRVFFPDSPEGARIPRVGRVYGEGKLMVESMLSRHGPGSLMTIPKGWQDYSAEINKHASIRA